MFIAWVNEPLNKCSCLFSTKNAMKWQFCSRENEKICRKLRRNCHHIMKNDQSASWKWVVHENCTKLWFYHEYSSASSYKKLPFIVRIHTLLALKKMTLIFLQQIHFVLSNRNANRVCCHADPFISHGIPQKGRAQTSAWVCHSNNFRKLK